MEAIATYDIVSFGDQFMVVVESDLLPPDTAIVVIPLIRGYPAVSKLNPTIQFQQDQYVLATRMIASVRRASVRIAGSAQTQRDEITRAVDVLMSGV